MVPECLEAWSFAGQGTLYWLTTLFVSFFSCYSFLGSPPKQATCLQTCPEDLLLGTLKPKQVLNAR